MTVSKKDGAFEALVRDVQACVLCPRMADSRRVLNRGCGPLTAEILVIGEAPGRLGADASELPFHGDKAGHNFEALMEQVGIRRSQLFITNAALCNPKNADGNNATPSDGELRACAAHLRRQIDLISPRIVVTLGAVALKAVGFIEAHNLELRTAVRSSFQWYGRELIPLYHPGQRAMIHRSFANQLSDYNFVAERVRRIEPRTSRASGRAKPDIASVAKMVLASGPRSYFSLHKLCYLAEVAHSKTFGKRLTSAYYIRQKDGPYCVDLHLQRLKRAGLDLVTSTRGGKLWVELKGPTLFSESDNCDVLSAAERQIVGDTLEKYAGVTDELLKTSAYLTRPMRQIIRRERQGSNQLNAPLEFEAPK